MFGSMAGPQYFRSFVLDLVTSLTVARELPPKPINWGSSGHREVRATMSRQLRHKSAASVEAARFAVPSAP